MSKSIFSRKPVSVILEESDSKNHSFHRTLTATNLVLLGVGGIIGAGIFVLTGQAAANYAGPAIVYSFILSGIACAFAGLCYAEFASMIPIAGSAYTYAYATMGQIIAWIIGWDLILEYLFGASTVAVGWSGYLVSFLKDRGFDFPMALASSPLIFHHDTGWASSGALFNLPAVVVVAIMTYLLYRGTKESARFNDVVVSIKVGVLCLFIIFGCQYIIPENWVPFVPPNTGDFGEFGWSGVFRGAGVIFFAYIGFDGLSTLSQEAKNPQRDMPIGIIGSLIICTIFYIAVSLVLTGVVKYTELGVADPMAVAVNAAGQGLVWLRPIIKLGAIMGLSSVVLSLLMAQPRILYIMAHDGLLPQIFAKMHPKYGTPSFATILTGVLAGIIAGLFPIGILGELVSIGTLFAFVIVCAGVLVLRYKEPEFPRPFKVPYPLIICPLGAISALLQMAALPIDTWIRLIVWMAVGLVIYFSYSRKHSVIQ